MCICASFYEYDGCCTYRIPSTPLPPSLPPSTTTQFNVYKVLLLAASQDVCLYFRLTTLAVLHLFALERLYSDFYVRVDARLPHAAATAILLTPSTLAVLHVASTCHLPHPFGHWPCQSQSHAPLLSLHARALTPFECHTGRPRGRGRVAVEGENGSEIDCGRFAGFVVIRLPRVRRAEHQGCIAF